MRIGVVAYEMEGSRTGVGRYLEGLLTGIAQSRNDWRWLLYFKGEPFQHPLWTRVGASGPLFQPIFDRRPRARPILWEQIRLPRLLRRTRLDVLFSPAYSLPRAGSLPSVVTIHDLSFEHLPEEFPQKELWRRRLLARSAVRRARRVLVDTQTIAADLESTYGLSRSRVGVVPLALDASFMRMQAPPAASDLAQLEELDIRPPYLLTLGSILERRHVDRVIETFAVLAAEDPELRLVLAGQNRLRRPRQLAAWIAASGVGDRIRTLGYVDEEALGALYRQAILSFYLSSYEGYGLPPLESLAMGTPAIVGKGLALDDLWPSYPYRCSSLDRDAVLATVRTALADGPPFEALTQEARERLESLTWKRSAERFLTEIERAVGP